MKKLLIISIFASLIVILIIFLFHFKLLYSCPKLVPKFMFGEEGDELGKFQEPFGIAIKDNYLFVSDSRNAHIQTLIINSDGNLSAKTMIGKRGEGLGEFQGNRSLAMKNSYLYVVDTANARIQVLEIKSDGDLMPKFSFGKGGKELGEFGLMPSFSIAVKNNYLFVADSGNARVQTLEIQPDGNLVPKFAFGQEGQGLGEFGRYPDSFPIGNVPGAINLCVKDDYLFVADSGNNRIQVFVIHADGALSPKFVFGKEGRGLGEFKIPLAMTVKDSHLFVADSGNVRMQVLEIRPNGKLLAKSAFGKAGREPGEYDIINGLAVKDNYLYVADSGNHCIQVLEIKK